MYSQIQRELFIVCSSLHYLSCGGFVLKAIFPHALNKLTIKGPKIEEVLKSWVRLLIVSFYLFSWLIAPYFMETYIAKNRFVGILNDQTI